MNEIDLFGEPIIDNKVPSLVERFGENPSACSKYANRQMAK